MITSTKSRPAGAGLRYLLLLPLLVVLSACATTAGYEKMLNSWLGAQEIDLVRSWGPPVQSYELDGHKFIVYVSQRVVHYPGTEPTFHTTIRDGKAYTTAIGGSPPMTVGSSCTTTFEIAESKIISWSHQGDDCRARE